MLCFHLEKKEAAALTEKSRSDSYQMPKVMLTLNFRGCQPLTKSQKHTLPKKTPQKSGCDGKIQKRRELSLWVRISARPCGAAGKRQHCTKPLQLSPATTSFYTFYLFLSWARLVSYPAKWSTNYNSCAPTTEIKKHFCSNLHFLGCLDLLFHLRVK